MNAFIFINWNRFSFSFLNNLIDTNPVGKHRCYNMDELTNEQWDELLNKKHTPKVKVQSGFIPDDYKQPNQNRQSDARQYVRPENTGLMVMSVYKPSLRFGYNAWNKWVYRQARKIVIPNHIKIQIPADEVKIKIS